MKTEKTYTFGNAVNDFIKGNYGTVNELMNRRGKQAFEGFSFGALGSIIMPFEERTISATAVAHGRENVGISVGGIEYALRNNSVLFDAGAQFFYNLREDTRFLNYTGTSVFFHNEVGEAPAGDGTFNAITLKPKRICCVVEISNTLLTQDEINISNYILNDIGRAIMQKLESTILSDAPATATTPAGLFSLIPAQTITPTYEELIDIEYQLETNNIYKDITYIASPSIRKTLKTTETVANTANFLWDKSFDKINGRKALSSNSVLADGLIVGQFSNLLVCFFGGLECTVDTKSKVLDNITRLICNVYADIAPLRTDSFITATI